MFKDYSEGDGEKKNVLKSVINAINSDIGFRLMARFEYEIDPADITRGFKPFSIRSKDEINL